MSRCSCGRGNSTVCAEFDARFVTSRARNQKCSRMSTSPKCSRVSAPERSSDRITACGSGATVNTVGMPSSRATSAAARLPTSAMRRCSRSTGPAARRMRRMPRRAVTRNGQAAAEGTGCGSSGTRPYTCPEVAEPISSRSSAAWATGPRESVITRSTPVLGSATSASPRRTSRVAMPPLSPAPTAESDGSMSACRNSCPIVSPSARATRGFGTASRSIRARRATSARRSLPLTRSSSASFTAATDRR